MLDVEAFALLLADWSQGRSKDLSRVDGWQEEGRILLEQTIMRAVSGERRMGLTPNSIPWRTVALD